MVRDNNLLLDENGGPNQVENYCDAPFMYYEERELSKTPVSFRG